MKTRRGTARVRIKKRLKQHFPAANLYEVQEVLQAEAARDSFAKDWISIWELISVKNGSGAGTSYGMGPWTYLEHR